MKIKNQNFCPNCRSKSLIETEVDLICADCDWNTFSMYVDAGGMDHLFKAISEHFSNCKSLKSNQPTSLTVDEINQVSA